MSKSRSLGAAVAFAVLSTAALAAAPANAAVVYCKTAGVPQGCVVRTTPVVVAPVRPVVRTAVVTPVRPIAPIYRAPVVGPRATVTHAGYLGTMTGDYRRVSYPFGQATKFSGTFHVVR